MRTTRIAPWCWLLVLLASSSGDARLWAGNPLDDYNLAVGLYKQSRWKLAESAFTDYLATHAGHDRVPAAKLYLGLTRINLDAFLPARTVLREFVKDYPRNPNLPQAKYRVGECSVLLEDWTAARTELETYLKDHPADAFADRALPLLGESLLRLNEPELALKRYDEAIERFPRGPLLLDAQFGRAQSLAALKQNDKAIDAYRELAKTFDQPRADEAQYALATLYFESERNAEAASAYEDLISRFSGSERVPAAYLNAGYARYRQGEYGAAADLFERASATTRQQVTAAYWQGLSLKQAAKPADALVPLRRAAEAAPADHPLLESIEFQRAICLRMTGDWTAARTQFLDVIARFPKGEFADDALYSAADASLELGDLTQTQTLLTQLREQYPTSGLRLYAELLSGRRELAVATREGAELTTDQRAAALSTAAERFELVLRESTIERTRQQATYDLALTRQLQGQGDVSIRLLEPLMDAWKALQPPPREYRGALFVLAQAHYAEQHWAPAERFARSGLELAVEPALLPAQRAQLLSIIAVSASHEGAPERAREAVATLREVAPREQATAATVFQLAKLAEESKQWPLAAEWYEQLVPLSEGTENQAFAYRGWAGALYEQQQFKAAAAQYANVVQHFREHRLAPESAYYEAESLRQAGEADAALAAYERVLTQYGPKEPAPPGAEQQPPLIFAYRAGLQEARTLRTDGKIEEADRVYDKLTQSFPQPMSLDRLLNEWAVMNYEHERFDRADELFRRLVERAPDSDLADNARLSLAESDLVAEKLEAAQTSFRALLDDSKSDAGVRERALYQLLVIEVEQRHWPQTIELAARFATEFPDSPQLPFATYCRAEAALAGGELSEADCIAVRDSLTPLMARKGDPATAEWTWYPRLWVLAADCALRTKDYAAIEALATELKSFAPQTPAIYQIEEVAGRAFNRQAKFNEARAAFQRVLDDPLAYRTETAAKAQFLIGETFFLQERWNDAFLAYQRVYTSYKFPEWQSAALLQSAKCDEKQGQWKEAVAGYRQLLAEFPQSTHVAEAKDRLTAAEPKATSP